MVKINWISFLWMVMIVEVVRGLALTPVPDRPQRCSYHRAFGMLGAHCSALNLYSIPATLKSSIEILDASFNRIRDLRNSTFQRYSSLRFLYLGDNMIQTMEAGTFEHLTSLETLDLSLNALTTIPEFILNLPSLRKLYLSDNALINLNKDLKNMEKPLAAPLNFLSISNCQLTEMPDFGILIHLEQLNLSSNQFRGLLPRDFAKMCSLKELDLTSALYANDFCTYKLLTQWFSEKHVNIIPDIYTIFNPDSEDARKCKDVPFEEDDIKVYTECHSTIKSRKMEKVAKKTWIIIVASLAAVLTFCAIVLFWLHKRNVKQTQINKKINLEKSSIKNNNTTNLLSDIS